MPKLDQDKLDQFFNSIQALLDDDTRLQDYLIRLKADSNKSPLAKGAVLLNESLLRQELEFIMAAREIIIDELMKLPDNQNLTINKTNTGRGDILLRALEFDIADDGTINAFVLPQSKDADGVKDPARKPGGTTKKVTLKVLLNPADNNVGLLDEVRVKTAADPYTAARIAREHEFYKLIYGIELPKGSKYEGKHGASYTTGSIAGIGPLSLLSRKTSKERTLQLDANYRSGKETEDQVLARLIGRILESMQKVHRAGVIHADIKNDNILLFLDRNGLLDARVIDFDMSVHAGNILSEEVISKIMEQVFDNPSEKDKLSDTLSSQPIPGTSLFVAPEVIRFYRFCKNQNLRVRYQSFLKLLDDNTKMLQIYGAQLEANLNLDELPLDAIIKPAHDMFSLGVTLFKLITGSYPSKVDLFDKNGPQTHVNVDEALFEFPLLKQFEDLIIKGFLAPNGEARPTADEAVSMYQEIHTRMSHNPHKFKPASDEVIPKQPDFATALKMWQQRELEHTLEHTKENKNKPVGNINRPE